MYLNDQYGDCTCAAAAHMIQNWTASAGREISPTDQDVLKFYEHFTTPGPDNGCNMLSVLKYWQSTGLAKDKITAFAQVENKNTTQAQDAVSMFGSLYIGVELPDFAVNSANMLEVPWVVPPQGPIGESAARPTKWPLRSRRGLRSAESICRNVGRRQIHELAVLCDLCG